MRSLPKSWSSTLSLPKSKFPPRPLLSDRPRYLKRCSDELYEWQKSRSSSKLFTLQDGPPYANGNLHIGHALNKILKDITCRYQICHGRRVQYVPGWDCHGLPIELKALQKERDLKLISPREQSGPAAQRDPEPILHGPLEPVHHEDPESAPHEHPDSAPNGNPEPVSLRKAARELAAETKYAQMRSFREWGVMADWENSWTTMDSDFEIRQLRVFEHLVHQGLIYRRFKPVYWSPSSRTALAEAELEYNEKHVSLAAFVKYKMHTLPQGLKTRLGLDAENINAVIWTTTPWTLPANKAIGINCDLNYVIVESEDHGFLLLAQARVEEVQRLSKSALTPKFILQGSELLGATYEDMTFNDPPSPRPLLHAAFVSAESGSGLVHLAPGHGMDDYELCTKYGIPAFAPLDDEGRFTALAAPSTPDLLLGKEALTSGNDTVLETLDKNKRVLGIHNHEHKYPYDWRLKRPVIVRATEQWFANVGELKKAALQALDAVTFIPEGGEERLRSFIKNRNEWCISRQRAWGVPIPALYHQITGEALMSKESVSHIITTIEARGIDSWWTDEDLDPVWTPPWLRDENGQTSYIRGKDTMDVWFDSGTSWTQLTNQSHQEGNHVADVYLEGTDQHRGWFQSSLLTYVAQQWGDNNKSAPTAPFKVLITHGFSLDQHGRKMSKSLGNVISPDEIMDGQLLPTPKKERKGKVIRSAADVGPRLDSMGPDALRLWVASCDFTKDVTLGRPVLQAIRGNLSKYRVTFKLLLGILEDCVPSRHIPFQQLQTNHQIALMQIQSLKINVQRHYQRFEYNKVISEINKHVADFSAFYIETIKDAAYAGGEESSGIASRDMTQYTLLHVFTALQQMLAPVTPLLIEETWDYTPQKIQEWHGYPFHRQWIEDSEVKGEENDRWHNEQLHKDLPVLMQTKAAITAAQETARGGKKMGSSLQSFVLIEVKQPSIPQSADELESTVFQLLNRYLADLETLFVVSKVDLSLGSIPSFVTDAAWSHVTEFDVGGEIICVHVYAPQKAKCVRCWRYAAPMDSSDRAALCERCETVTDALRVEKPELFQPEAIDDG